MTSKSPVRCPMLTIKASSPLLERSMRRSANGDEVIIRCPGAVGEARPDISQSCRFARSRNVPTVPEVLEIDDPGTSRPSEGLHLTASVQGAARNRQEWPVGLVPASGGNVTGTETCHCHQRTASNSGAPKPLGTGNQ